MLRCKFQVIQVNDNGPHAPKSMAFEARHDPLLAEDVRFAKQSPHGVLRAWIDNPAGIDLQVGDLVWVDITKIVPLAEADQAPELLPPAA